jgi:hypothetical protein
MTIDDLAHATIQACLLAVPGRKRSCMPGQSVFLPNARFSIFGWQLVAATKGTVVSSSRLAEPNTHKNSKTH